MSNSFHGPYKTNATKMSNTNPNYGHSKILSNLIHAMNHSSSSHAMTSSSAGNGASMVACSSSSCDRQSPLLQGYLYKIHKRNGKTQKYFVIFDDVPDKPGTGRLEYFDSEKKFKSAMAKSKTGGITNEKRSIILCTCFNINRRFDTKYRNVIGLYRKDDTFSIMAKDESECNTWLKQMLILQRGKESVDADQPRPTFGKYTLNLLLNIKNGRNESKPYLLCQVMPICMSIVISLLLLSSALTFY